MAEQRVGRYRLTRKIVPGDSKRGIPDLWQAEDQGDVYYAKLWSKGPGDSAAIQALWNREVRGLMRLQGYPGASELFVKLRDLDSDEKYFSRSSTAGEDRSSPMYCRTEADITGSSTWPR